jgi:hypothetical protein
MIVVKGKAALITLPLWIDIAQEVLVRAEKKGISTDEARDEILVEMKDRQ